MNEDFYIDQYYEDRQSGDGECFDYEEDCFDYGDGDSDTCPVCDSDDIEIRSESFYCHACGFFFIVTHAGFAVLQMNYNKYWGG